jgi:multisubunit Na+/H+ antiporter MnhC subunit
MTPQAALVFGTFAVGAVLVMMVGFYSLLSTRNLIRSIISLEILSKSVTLLIILAGYTAAQQALAQSLAITLIVIEVAVMVVGVGLVLRIHAHTGSIDTNTVENIKG